MKFPSFNKLKQTRVNSEDSLGHGMDAAILMALFFLAGFGIDRLAGTTPVFMIVMTVLGAIGIFTRFKYAYEAKMAEHDAARRPSSGTATAESAADSERAA